MTPPITTSATTKTFGQIVKARREAIELSSELLAGRAEISIRTLDRIEGDETSPQRTTRKAILAALETAEAERAARELAA